MTQKSRLMFIKSEDYNFLTYNLFIVLQELKCNSIDKAFYDHKKLPYLLLIISDKRYLNLYLRHIENDNRTMNPTDKKLLIKLFYDWKTIGKQVEQLLYILRKKDYIKIVKDKGRVDLHLINDNLSLSYLEWDSFDYERQNLKNFLKKNSRLRTIKHSTFMEKIFYHFDILKCDF